MGRTNKKVIGIDSVYLNSFLEKIAPDNQFNNGYTDLQLELLVEPRKSRYLELVHKHVDCSLNMPPNTPFYYTIDEFVELVMLHFPNPESINLENVKQELEIYIRDIDSGKIKLSYSDMRSGGKYVAGKLLYE